MEVIRMAQVGYSKKVLDHFTNPRNVGAIENADGYGKVGNPVCGDLMEIYITVKDDIIEDIKFKTFGCGSAIATSSMVTELAKGMHIDEAMKITRNDVATELDGLPAKKMHCSNLAADALHEAIENYKRKRDGIPEEAEDDKSKASCDTDDDSCHSCAEPEEGF
jgi:nitrogen fixation NifU-like protein